MAYDQQDYAVATRLFEEALTLSPILGDTGGETDLLITAVRQARRDGQYRRATALLEDALSWHRRLNERASSSNIDLGLIAEFANVLRELALMVREQGDFARATALVNHALATARSMLGETTFAAVWAEAQSLPVEQILSGLPCFAALTAVRDRSET
jgi:tetratricopeptide (TPR) repeat protein